MGDDQPTGEAERAERVRQARGLADIARRHPIWTPGFRSLIALDDEVDRLESAMERVREVHEGGDMCMMCGGPAPCETLRALDGARL